MEYQPTVTLADIMAQLTALTQTISEVQRPTGWSREILQSSSWRLARFTQGTLPRTMWPNLMSSSFVVVPTAQKVAPNFFLDLGLLLENLWIELLAQGVIKLEKAYVLVQDLDSVRTKHTFKSHDHRASTSRPFPSPQSHKSSIHPPPSKD